MRSAYFGVRRYAEVVGYRRDFARFSKLAVAEGRSPPRWNDRFPCLGEKGPSTPFDRHYLYHTSWAARILAQTRPDVHVDVSSSLFFVGLVSAFVPVRHYDYRPPALQLPNLGTGFADLTALPFSDGQITSLSCMHVLEHVGLGRYGDVLDPSGDTKAMRELNRSVKRGGDLLIVVPVGRPRICFNAHRVYGYDQVVDNFAAFDLREFRLVPDDPSDGALVEADRETVNKQNYGCGCFWFRKPS